MKAQTVLRLDKLVLTNFRCFERCTLDLHPELTVLVAENGGGKTALLDAATIALSPFIEGMYRTDKAHDATPELRSTDVQVPRPGTKPREAASSATCTAMGLVDGTSLEWSQAIEAKSKRRPPREGIAPQLIDAARHLRKAITKTSKGKESATTLPVLASYATERLHNRWARRDIRYGSKLWPTRMGAYLDAFDPLLEFDSFVQWYRETTESAKRAIPVGRKDPARPEFLLAAVNAAVAEVLEPTGWTELRLQQDKKDLMYGGMYVHHKELGTVAVERLSDGVKTMTAMVADIAHRCARLNPHLGVNTAKKSPGVVLIDEVDLHLHPKWQQVIVELLRTAFPNIQFILTTHSPQVLSTVHQESIRLVGHENGVGKIDIPSMQTRGVESADILGMIMRIDPVPAVPEARLLTDYRAMAQQGEDLSKKADALWKRLVAHFGEDHPVMHGLSVMRRLQAFKRKHKTEAEGDAKA